MNKKTAHRLPQFGVHPHPAQRTHQIRNVRHLHRIVHHVRPGAAVALVKHGLVHHKGRLDVLDGLAHVALVAARPVRQHVGHVQHAGQARSGGEAADVLLAPVEAPLHAAGVGAALVGGGARLEDDVRMFLVGWWTGVVGMAGKTVEQGV